MITHRMCRSGNNIAICGARQTTTQRILFDGAPTCLACAQLPDYWRVIHHVERHLIVGDTLTATVDGVEMARLTCTVASLNITRCEQTEDGTWYAVTPSGVRHPMTPLC